MLLFLSFRGNSLSLKTSQKAAVITTQQEMTGILVTVSRDILRLKAASVLLHLSRFRSLPPPRKTRRERLVLPWRQSDETTRLNEWMENQRTMTYGEMSRGQRGGSSPHLPHPLPPHHNSNLTQGWFISFPLSTERSRKNSINTSGTGEGWGGGGGGYRMLFEFWILFSSLLPRHYTNAGVRRPPSLLPK